jgi:hypothetical protein
VARVSFHSHYFAFFESAAVFFAGEKVTTRLTLLTTAPLTLAYEVVPTISGVRDLNSPLEGTHELFRHFYGSRRFTKGKDRPYAAVVGVFRNIDRLAPSPRRSVAEKGHFDRLLALLLLVLHCMSITLDQIAELEERLRTEIVQRECLLAAIGVFRTYSAKGQWPESLDLGSLTAALVRPVHEVGTEPAPLPAPAPPALPPAPQALPPAPPPKRYIHPELEELTKRRRNNVAVVRWAIGQMTDDFSVADIRRLLEREGCSLQGPEISVVLTQLKRDGRIEEIKQAQGPIGATFRKPDPGFADAVNTPETAQARLERVMPEIIAQKERLKASFATR